MVVNIITRSTRLHNLEIVKESIFENVPKEIKINWHVVFDTNSLKDIDAELLSTLKCDSTEYYFIKGDSKGMLYPQCSEIISKFNSGWVYFVDDDNIVHPEFYQYIFDTINKDSQKMVHVVSQNVAGKDFTGLDYRLATGSSMKVGSIDLAQYIVHVDVYNKYDYTYKPDYCADGILISQVYKDHPEWFTFTAKELAHYNYLQKKSTAKIPKIIYIGEDSPVLKSYKVLNYEEDSLDVMYLKDDTDINMHIVKFRPDLIVTRNESWKSFQTLSSLPLQFRKRWINFPSNTGDVELGEMAYKSSMSSMMSPDGLEDSDLISYFTPIYNTGEKLRNTYGSLKAQTNNNWEWVIVNDSTDGGRTLKIAEDIARLDPRVRVYDFREKSGGNIGEVKWRACSLARGYILAELDHDDLLVPWCTEDLYKASKKHPEAGFFFNDTAEVNEQWVPQTYPEGFALSYGSYRDEHYYGLDLKVANQHNLNPLTIRHIVGVPNHVRAWRRSTYFEIGGHNRNLTIADDYELVVRTFLNTITCKIPKLGYIQFLYNNANGQNTHDMARADIQRRVRTIADFYNVQIKNRFTELGLHDWAYSENPQIPLSANPRHGDSEMVANITYIEE